MGDGKHPSRIVEQGFRKVSSDSSQSFLPEYFYNSEGEVKILNRATATTEMFQNVLADPRVASTADCSRKTSRILEDPRALWVTKRVR